MKNIFVLGSLNMDMVINAPYMPQNGETLHGSGFMTNPGGKGANQAVACSKLGAKTFMIGKVGNDVFGEELKTALQGYGVVTDYVFKSTKTASGVAMIIKSDQDNRIILDAGSNFELTIEEVKGALAAQAVAGDLLVTQLETPLEVVEATLQVAKEKGMYTVFNPAPAQKIKEVTYGFIDLLILNQSECELMTGYYPTDEHAYHNIGSFFTTRGVKALIITLGKAGGVLYQAGQLVKYEAEKVQTVDTTAAGDAYIGSIASSLAKGNQLVESLSEASKVAALTVMKQGAQQAIPTEAELHAYRRGTNATL